LHEKLGWSVKEETFEGCVACHHLTVSNFKTLMWYCQNANLHSWYIFTALGKIGTTQKW
jgi:hypothetical protein